MIINLFPKAGAKLKNNSYLVTTKIKSITEFMHSPYVTILRDQRSFYSFWLWYIVKLKGAIKDKKI